MALKKEDALSELARDLLVSERSRIEPAAIKVRAMARARAAFEGARQVQTNGRGTSGWSSFRGAPRWSQLGLAAGAFALVGLAAAAALLPDEPRLQKATRHVAATAAPLERRSESSRSSSAPSVPAPPASTTSVPVTVRLPNATAPKRSNPNQYALELALLEPGRHALVQGNHAAALEAVARHEQAFPNGQLAEERSALRVRALWVAGRRAEAMLAAERFRRSYPRSGLLAWMRERAP